MDSFPFAGDGEGLQASDPRTACRSKACWICHLCPEGHQGETPDVSVSSDQICQVKFTRSVWRKSAWTGNCVVREISVNCRASQFHTSKFNLIEICVKRRRRQIPYRNEWGAKSAQTAPPLSFSSVMGGCGSAGGAS